MRLQNKKILYTANTDIHLINFHEPHIEYLREQGYEVHVACHGSRPVKGASLQFDIPFERSPWNRNNILAVKRLTALLKEHHYTLVHTHTAICGVITRLAALPFRKLGCRVLYTAHGFSFYNGCSKKIWALFYPIELFLSRYTDAIITMNREDYTLTQKDSFRTKAKYHIDGIGVNPERLRYSAEETNAYREELEIPNDNLVVLYIAEFIPRKNHEIVFKVLPDLIQRHPKTTFLFAGGFAKTKAVMEDLAEANGTIGQVRFLGYVKEIGKVLSLANIGLTSSRAEGLPIGLLEYMYNRIPVVASEIRGHVDVIENGVNGFLFSLKKPTEMIEALDRLLGNEKLRKDIGEKACASIEKYSRENAVKGMSLVYDDFLK